MEKTQLTSQSPEQTHHIGRLLGGLLQAGDWIGLAGDLGAGKTHLTKGVAQGLGFDADQVTSPTYIILQTYQARLCLHHLDLYRLDSYDELLAIGYQELTLGDSVCMVEWYDRVPECTPTQGVTLSISLLSDQARRFDLVGLGDRGKTLVTALAREVSSKVPMGVG